MHQFVEIIKRLWVTVYRYFTLVGCGNIPQISRQGFKHLTVVGRYDTTGPLADLFDHIVHVDKGGFIMANLLVKVQKSIFHNLKIEY